LPRIDLDEAETLDQQSADLGLHLIKTIACGYESAGDARITGSLWRFQFHGDLFAVSSYE
jgi:hypothetical protein